MKKTNSQKRRERKKKKREMRNGKQKHHIIPSSRLGTNEKENIHWIDEKTHTDYHRLFINMTPVEILHFLFKIWNYNYTFLYEFKKCIEEGEGYD